MCGGRGNGSSAQRRLELLHATLEEFNRRRKASEARFGRLRQEGIAVLAFDEYDKAILAEGGVEKGTGEASSLHGIEHPLESIEHSLRAKAARFAAYQEYLDRQGSPGRP